MSYSRVTYYENSKSGYICLTWFRFSCGKSAGARLGGIRAHGGKVHSLGQGKIDE